MTTTQACLDILRELVSDINCTGGVRWDRNGNYVPMVDPDWVDLGATVVKAHEELLAAGWPSKLEGYDD